MPRDRPERDRPDRLRQGSCAVSPRSALALGDHLEVAQRGLGEACHPADVAIEGAVRVPPVPGEVGRHDALELHPRHLLVCVTLKM